MQSRRGLVCQQEKSWHYDVAGDGELGSHGRIASKRSGRMAPLCYSNVEVELHRSVGSLVQSRLGLVCQQEKSCFFPEGTTMWLEMENSVANGGC